jgi:hypothetical protein
MFSILDNMPLGTDNDSAVAARFIATGYVALADLPGIEKAAVFEPAPEEIYEPETGARWMTSSPALSTGFSCPWSRPRRRWE